MLDEIAALSPEHELRAVNCSFLLEEPLANLSVLSFFFLPVLYLSRVASAQVWRPGHSERDGTVLFSVPPWVPPATLSFLSSSQPQPPAVTQLTFLSSVSPPVGVILKLSSDPAPPLPLMSL